MPDALAEWDSVIVGETRARLEHRLQSIADAPTDDAIKRGIEEIYTDLTGETTINNMTLLWALFRSVMYYKQLKEVLDHAHNPE